MMGAEDWASVHLLSLVARVLQGKSAAYLKALGLPQLDFYILEHLAERTPMPQSELARLILVRPQTIRVVLTTLEDKQLVTRQRGLGQNQVAVSITDQGRALLAAAQECLQSIQLPADVEALRPILSTFIQRTAH